MTVKLVWAARRLWYNMPNPQTNGLLHSSLSAKNGNLWQQGHKLKQGSFVELEQAWLFFSDHFWCCLFFTPFCLNLTDCCVWKCRVAAFEPVWHYPPCILFLQDLSVAVVENHNVALYAPWTTVNTKLHGWL